MNKIVLGFSFIIGLSACSQMHNKKVEAIRVTCEHYPIKEDTTYHRICLDSACIYICNFLQYENLNHQARVHGLGGFIPIEPSIKDSKKPALKFYPCYEKIPVLRDNVFMAYEIGEDVDPRTPNCDIYKDELSISNDPFFYKEKGISPEEVNIYLHEQDDNCGDAQNLIKKQKVQAYNDTFFNKYTSIGSERISKPEYNCGAIFYGDIKRLIIQKGIKGFRYFFGYDRRKENSKLRIILIAVKEDDTNLLEYEDRQEAIILERHWPPD